ncbi:MerR family transcriptional regulator [Enterococcus sp. HY326]|uniref:MerR family transcriptional regulator n=1 Tax=Enterococcus sp. HY326 TaxID=2971265 RepID=UPI00223EF24A|nr:MerR family transcriptional regulator [Enterococcus sp. HY326]
MNIKEASLKVSLTPDTIRYYEKIGLVPPVNRNENGIRNFTSDDLCWLRFAKDMRDSGLSIGASIRYIKLYDDGGDTTLNERKNILAEEQASLQEKIAEMQASLTAIAFRIEHIEELEGETKSVYA